MSEVVSPPSGPEESSGAGVQASGLRAALLTAGALCSGWILLAWFLAPWIIRSGYERSSIPLVNDLITGQHTHSVDFYLGMLRRMRAPGTIALVVVVLVFVGTHRFHRPVWRSIVRGIRSGPPVTGIGLVLLGGVMGWLTGMFEAARVLLGAMGHPSGPGVELLWMSPSAGAASGVVVGGLLSATARVTGLSLRTGLFTLALLFGLNVIRQSGLGIHPIAGLVLALGVAHQLSSVLASRHESSHRLSRRALPALLTVSVFVGLAIPGGEALRARRAVASLPPAPEGAPNVLLLIMDTQRADRMSLYGHSRQTTPNLDRLAERSLVFDQALSTTSWTLPSHASMLTGRWASEVSADWGIPLDDRDRTLGEALSANGYVTGGFIGNTYFASSRSGLARGFATYRDHAVTLHDWVNSFWLSNRSLLFIRRAYGEHRRSRKRAFEINEQLLDWLDDVERPFFAMVNYFDVHDRFDAPAPFDTLFRKPAPRFWVSNWLESDTHAEADIAEMLDAYDSSVTYLDHHIGRLLESLEDQGTLDNTIIVVTADHGEHFGERQIVSHGNSLYLPGVRVPLIVTVPGSTAGARTSRPVSIRDIPATVLDLAGVGGEGLPGRSLLRTGGLDTNAVADGPPASSGASMDGAVEQGVVHLDLTARSFFLPPDPVRFGAMKGAVIGSFHYLVDGRGEEELFDIARDPEQMDNLIQDPQYAEVRERLRRIVAERPEDR